MKAGILLLLPLCFLLLSNSCSKTKSEDKLPPETQTGANTFGCLVDGKVWIPTGGGVGSGINPTSGGFYETPNNKKNIYIRASSDNDGISVFLKEIFSIGTYSLNKATAIQPNAIYPDSYGAFIQKFSGTEKYFITNVQYTGSVTITYADTISNVVSGRFEFTAQNMQSGEIKNITEGRFDYKTH